MPEYKITVRQGGGSFEISGSPGRSILECLRDAGFNGIHAPCGGRGTCRQCRVTAEGRLRSVDSGEIVEVHGGELLACRYAAAGDCTVTVPEQAAISVETRGAGDIAPCGHGLGAAVDIGTTTVAVYLYDLESGRRLAVAGGRNAQRPFGADVISRIDFCSQPGGLEKLSAAIRSQIDGFIADCCRRCGRDTSEVRRVSIAGNTVMEHIFDLLSPVSIGVAPFRTLSLFGDVRPAAGVLASAAPDAEIYLCPALAGYVGGDITAGLLASGASSSDGECLFIDIGTNGEMGLGSAAGFVCCATAAGPAFEGAEIECGMDGSAGAVSAVRLEDGEVRFDVIGAGEAKGVCGSGLIDALCVMLRCGAVQENGRMCRPDEAPEAVAHMLRPGPDGQMRFHLTDRVFISAADVRQIQMAKSAIRAGIETLMAKRGVSYSDIDRVIIAGGFGAYMNVRSACAIGLLPPALMAKTAHAGNTAGAGAALALTGPARDELSKLAGRCEYLELSGSGDFMEKYIECMAFDEFEEVF